MDIPKRCPNVLLMACCKKFTAPLRCCMMEKAYSTKKKKKSSTYCTSILDFSFHRFLTRIGKFFDSIEDIGTISFSSYNEGDIAKGFGANPD